MNSLINTVALGLRDFQLAPFLTQDRQPFLSSALQLDTTERRHDHQIFCLATR